MNYLIIAFITFYLLSNKRDTLNELLASIPIEDALPLLKMLGVSDDSLQIINSLLPSLLEGNLDLTSISKILFPLIQSLNFLKTQKTPSENGEGLCAVEEFAPEEILNGIKDYFA